MIQPLLVMISIKYHMKLKVSGIFLICAHLNIVYIILVSYDDCSLWALLGSLISLRNTSGYVYCTTPGSGIKQLCPLGAKVSFNIDGCVNKTSK
jgi:hypothetical protein